MHNRVLSLCLFLALALPVWAQPLYRSPFTTNAAPQTNTAIYGNYNLAGGASSLVRTKTLLGTNASIEILGIPSLDDPLGSMGIKFETAPTRTFGIRTAQTTNQLGFYGWANVIFDLATFNTANVTTLNAAGANFTGPALSTSTSSNSPAQNELVQAQWVRSLFNNGVAFFTTTNIDGTATNVGSGQPVFKLSTEIPTTCTNFTVSPTNNQYINSEISTNTFFFIQGPVAVDSYIQQIGGTISIHPEIYYSYDKTNWLGDFEGPNQSITTLTNHYQWVIAMPSISSTNSTGFWIQRRFKVSAVASAPTIVFHYGTNWISGASAASKISFSGPNSASGDVFLPANQTFTGSNTFTKTVNLTSLQWTPFYSNSVTAATNIYAVLGQHETIVDVQTNGVCFLLSTNRLSNLVATVNFTLKNFCGSNAVVTMNPSWIPLGVCTNNVTLTNGKVMRLSCLFASRAIAGWDSETNVIFGYSIQP